MDKLTELVNRFGWKVIEIQEDHSIASNELLDDSCVVMEKSTSSAGRLKRSSIDKKAKVLDVNLTDFLRWCENRNDEIVGYAGSNWIGPIACYLKSTTDCSSVFVMPGCVKLDGQCFQPPYWFDYVEESLEETGSVSIIGLDVVETLKSYIQVFSAVSNQGDI